MRLTDAHCHGLDPARAPAGLVRAVVAGTRPADWDGVAALARADARVLPAFGLHPWHVAGAAAGWLDDLRARLLDDPRASVGEVGLDRTARASAPLDAQVAALSAQLALAAELGRAATLHCVRAWGALLAVLDAVALPARGVVVHGFAGDRGLARDLVRRGALLSYPAGAPTRAAPAFADAPAGRLLVETDGDGGDPAALPGAYAALAALRGVALAELVDEVDATAARTFG